MKSILIFISLITIGLVSGCSGPGHHSAFEQLKSNSTGPILSIQDYVVRNHEKSIELKKRWLDIAKAMRQQPGFISSYLNRGIGDSSLWIVRSQWESVDALRKAFSDQDVLRIESYMPNQQFEHLFSIEKNQKLAVCVRKCI